MRSFPSRAVSRPVSRSSRRGSRFSQGIRTTDVCLRAYGMPYREESPGRTVPLGICSHPRGPFRGSRRPPTSSLGCDETQKATESRPLRAAIRSSVETTSSRIEGRCESRKSFIESGFIVRPPCNGRPHFRARKGQRAVGFSSGRVRVNTSTDIGRGRFPALGFAFMIRGNSRRLESFEGVDPVRFRCVTFFLCSSGFSDTIQK